MYTTNPDPYNTQHTELTTCVQEHAANKIMKDITGICLPKSMTINLDYQIRGGLHSSVKVNYKNPGTNI